MERLFKFFVALLCTLAVVGVWEASKGWAVILGVTFLFVMFWERMWPNKEIGDV